MNFIKRTAIVVASEPQQPVRPPIKRRRVGGLVECTQCKEMIDDQMVEMHMRVEHEHDVKPLIDTTLRAHDKVYVGGVRLFK